MIIILNKEIKSNRRCKSNIRPSDTSYKSCEKSSSSFGKRLQIAMREAARWTTTPIGLPFPIIIK